MYKLLIIRLYEYDSEYDKFYKTARDKSEIDKELAGIQGDVVSINVFEDCIYVFYREQKKGVKK